MCEGDWRRVLAIEADAGRQSHGWATDALWLIGLLRRLGKDREQLPVLRAREAQLRDALRDLRMKCPCDPDVTVDFQHACERADELLAEVD
jgi:hypothetical protein